MIEPAMLNPANLPAAAKAAGAPRDAHQSAKQFADRFGLALRNVEGQQSNTRRKGTRPGPNAQGAVAAKGARPSARGLADQAAGVRQGESKSVSARRSPTGKKARPGAGAGSTTALASPAANQASRRAGAATASTATATSPSNRALDRDPQQGYEDRMDDQQPLAATLTQATGDAGLASAGGFEATSNEEDPSQGTAISGAAMHSLKALLAQGGLGGEEANVQATQAKGGTLYGAVLGADLAGLAVATGATALDPGAHTATPTKPTESEAIPTAIESLPARGVDRLGEASIVGMTGDQAALKEAVPSGEVAVSGAPEGVSQDTFQPNPSESNAVLTPSRHAGDGLSEAHSEPQPPGGNVLAESGAMADGSTIAAGDLRGEGIALPGTVAEQGDAGMHMPPSLTAAGQGVPQPAGVAGQTAAPDNPVGSGQAGVSATRQAADTASSTTQAPLPSQGNPLAGQQDDTTATRTPIGALQGGDIPGGAGQAGDLSQGSSAAPSASQPTLNQPMQSQPAPAPSAQHQSTQHQSTQSQPVPLLTPAQQLASALGALRRRGDGSYATEITLNPKELGQVRLQVQVAGTTVHMQATALDPATRALLDAGLGELSQALTDAGLESGQLDVSQGDGQGDDTQTSPFVGGDTHGVQPVSEDDLGLPATPTDYITATGVNTLA